MACKGVPGWRAGSPFPADGPSDAEVEAARLALDLAHERAQRQKAERDFEVCSHPVTTGKQCFQRPRSAAELHSGTPARSTLLHVLACRSCWRACKARPGGLGPPRNCLAAARQAPRRPLQARSVGGSARCRRWLMAWSGRIERSGIAFPVRHPRLPPMVRHIVNRLCHAAAYANMLYPALTLFVCSMRIICCKQRQLILWLRLRRHQRSAASVKHHLGDGDTMDVHACCRG